MKTNGLFFVALISIILLSSCGQNSGNLIGTFKVIKKEKANRTYDYGFVTLTSSKADTLKVFVPSVERYLNIKIGDNVQVGRNSDKTLFIRYLVKSGVVGYAMVFQKKLDMGKPMCKVITRGQDTISIKSIAEVVYYNISAGDSVLVKRNMGRDKPHYFVE